MSGPLRRGDEVLDKPGPAYEIDAASRDVSVSGGST